MPRYYFDVTNGLHRPDLEGVELGGLAAARAGASSLAGRLLIDHPEAFWTDREWCVEVKDERGLILFVLHLSATDAPAVRGVAAPTPRVAP